VAVNFKRHKNMCAITDCDVSHGNATEDIFLLHQMGGWFCNI